MSKDIDNVDKGMAPSSSRQTRDDRLRQLKDLGIKKLIYDPYNFKHNKLLELGFSLKEIIDNAYPIDTLVNYDFNILDGPGFSVKELIDYGFSLRQLKKVGASIRELKDYGFSLQRLKDVGFSLQQLIYYFSLEQLKDVGFSGDEFIKCGFSLQQLIDNDFSLRQLRDAGYSVKQSIEDGYTLQQLKDAGFSIRELLYYGFTLQQLKNVGFSAREFRLFFKENLTLRELIDYGFSLQQLRDAGFLLKELNDAGYSLTLLEENGFLEKEYKLYKTRSMSQSFKVGDKVRVSESVDVDSRIRPGQIGTIINNKYLDLYVDFYDYKYALKFNPNDLILVDYPIINHEHLSARQLKDEGFTAKELNKNFDVSLQQLIHIGFSVNELKKAGFSLSELQQTDIQLREFKNSDFTLREFYERGFTLQQLEVIFTDVDPKGLYFKHKLTVEEIFKLGFTYEEIRYIYKWYKNITQNKPSGFFEMTPLKQLQKLLNKCKPNIFERRSRKCTYKDGQIYKYGLIGGSPFVRYKSKQPNKKQKNDNRDKKYL